LAQSASARPHGLLHQPFGLLRHVPERHCSSTTQSSPMPSSSSHPVGKQAPPPLVSCKQRKLVGHATDALHVFAHMNGNPSSGLALPTQSRPAPHVAADWHGSVHIPGGLYPVVKHI
jgi:hypothetical protein